jgi:DtxR family Mn-dependent transcriptional regulator
MDMSKRVKSISPSAALSPSVEDYLLAIHRLGQAHGGVSTTRLARQLRVRPASVTGMLHRLADMRLVKYRRYREISLSSAGEKLASELVRRHRLTERLLTDVLGVPLEEVHDEACRLEHAVSPALQGRIADALGAPEACPHGHPLDANAEDETLSLAEAPPNRSLVIVRLDNEASEVVHYLTQRKLLPGARLKVKLREPLGGSMVLDIKGGAQVLEAQMAANIRVRPVTSRR